MIAYDSFYGVSLYISLVVYTYLHPLRDSCVVASLFNLTPTYGRNFISLPKCPLETTYLIEVIGLLLLLM